MQGMILTVLSSAAGSAAGCILSLYLGRPGKRAKADPFSKRILPLCAGFLLMILAIPAAPGILFLTSPASPILTCPPAGTRSSDQP